MRTYIYGECIKCVREVGDEDEVMSGDDVAMVVGVGERKKLLGNKVYRFDYRRNYVKI